LGVRWTLRAACRSDEHAVIVTVFPDSGEKYLSDKFWSEE
jgi:cysteine synthase